MELSRQDKQALRGFSVYVASCSDGAYTTLVRHQSHDTDRAQRRVILLLVVS